ncbi:hypothetical protein AVEN_184067-1 [Araneus ventricosus]|uniref:CCHC-type domain-containing protein n=1 Tax=Araneus ventricosus TaxID=182803 RepID=A0A4Y2CZQ9_ARAVE|nr:hypothetical protein AVEN_184067-1 [Araneus ventricosus]
MPKPLITCRKCNKIGHIAKNCVVKAINHSNDESLSVRQVGENSEESNSYLKKAKLNNFDPVQALIDTGSSCCLLKTSVTQKLKLKPEPTVNEIYGLGNQKMPALTSMGRITADIEIDKKILPKTLDAYWKLKDGKTCVPLANIGNKNIEFLKDQCLGRAEVIELCSNVKVKEKTPSSNNLNNFKEKVPIILSEINIDSNIENERKQELVQLLNEYRDCFALNISELGSTNLTKIDIKEVEGSKPVCMKEYKTNAPERAAIKEIVREWRENGIVSDS